MGSSREVVLAQFLADLSSVEPGRIAVILDDYHLVEASLGCAHDPEPDAGACTRRACTSSSVAAAARTWRWAACSRRGASPSSPIDDLRFTLPEIEQLFAETYGQPLDGEACRVIAERTEGWAASLQLVSASIAVSQPSEVAAFIDALSGATGPIYDFLAEEVLTRLSPQTQRILIHASLVDRVRPEYVMAALSVADGAPGDRSGEQALDDAEALGLLGVGAGLHRPEAPSAVP